MNPMTFAIIVFVLELSLLIFWIRSRRRKDGNDAKLCLAGFLVGQAYLIYELILIKHTGKPDPGSPEQKMLMARFVLGASLGGWFTIMGLFYLSAKTYGLKR